MTSAFIENRAGELKVRGERLEWRMDGIAKSRCLR